MTTNSAVLQRSRFELNPSYDIAQRLLNLLVYTNGHLTTPITGPISREHFCGVLTISNDMTADSAFLQLT